MKVRFVATAVLVAALSGFSHADSSATGALHRVTGASSTVSFLTAQGTGVDVTAMLAGLVTSPGAYLVAGIVAESALAAVTIFDNLFGTQWYGLTIPSAVDADSIAVERQMARRRHRSAPLPSGTNAARPTQKI